MSLCILFTHGVLEFFCNPRNFWIHWFTQEKWSCCCRCPRAQPAARGARICNKHANTQHIHIYIYKCLATQINADRKHSTHTNKNYTKCLILFLWLKGHIMWNTILISVLGLLCCFCWWWCSLFVCFLVLERGADWLFWTSKWAFVSDSQVKEFWSSSGKSSL